MSDVQSKSVGNPGVGPRSRAVSAFPGAPGVPGGVKSAPAGSVAQSVVGNNDYLSGGPSTVPPGQTFPGNGAPAETGISTAGQAWQRYQTDDPLRGEPVMGLEASGHVSGGIRVSHPEAFPGGGQHV